MIFKTKKNRIILLLLLFFFIDAESDLYSQDEIQNFYWSNNIIGPDNINEAKKLFLKNKNPNQIEGIWFQEQIGKIVILKSKEINGNTYLYKKYIVEHLKNEKLNGTLLGTLFKTKKKNIFVIFERPDLILQNKIFSENDNATGIFEYNSNQKPSVLLIKGTKQYKKLKKKILLFKLYPDN